MTHTTQKYSPYSTIHIHSRAILTGALFFFSATCADEQRDITRTTTPRLTIVFIIDQCAYSYIQNLQENFSGGLKYILEQGTHYTNAYWPHATPATAVGHAGLNTGTFALYHGIVGNSWYSNGKAIHAHPHYLMVDGLSDQYVLAGTSQKRHFAYALSTKKRAAQMLAGKAGKAIWFDFTKGKFTSSTYYFTRLPGWVAAYNKNNQLNTLTNFTWEPCYPLTSAAYATATHEYQYSSTPSLLNTTISIDHTAQEPYAPLYKSPYLDKQLLNLAQECIHAHLADQNNQLLLWVSLSSLDPVAHAFGPNSAEACDILYHLDKNLKVLLATLQTYIEKKDICIALTADHGGMPVLEQLQKNGYTAIKRIIPKKLVTTINTVIEKKHDIAHLVEHYKNSQLFFNQSVYPNLPKKEQRALIKTVKKTLLHTQGIRAVWTNKELDAVTTPDIDTFKFNYAQQRYPGRTGNVYVQPCPYTLISKWQTGTAHKSPYNYDTHVPLIICWPNQSEKKVITTKVWPLQLAPTLADLLNIPRPSAATTDILPGIEF